MCMFQKYSWCFVLAVVALMSGCNSILYGKQYAVPQPGQPSATVRMKYDNTARLDLMTFIDKGCYAGSPLCLPLVTLSSLQWLWIKN